MSSLDKTLQNPAFRAVTVFAAIRDDDAGHWSIRPTAPSTSTRLCIDGTMALQTTSRTHEGTLKLSDAGFAMKARWVAGERPRAGGQRCVDSTATRCLRRTLRRGVPGSRATHRDRTGHSNLFMTGAPFET